MNSLYQKSLLKLIDLNVDEIQKIINKAIHLKCQKNTGREIPLLKGKNIALIFEKQSTRTLCAFEVSAFDQGANITNLTPEISQIRHKESIADTAKILGRMYHGIMYRGYHQNIIDILAQNSKIPVWNGLTNKYHPTQILADLMTMKEKLQKKDLKQAHLAYIGDARNNIANTLLEAVALIGFNLRLIAPNKLWPEKELFNKCKKLAQKIKGDIILTDNILYGIKNVDFLYTDVWVSMGEDKSTWDKRIKLLKNYQVNKNLIDKIENPNVKFLHCLPAFHDDKTDISKKIIKKYNLMNGVEVTDDVFNSSYSVVFDQAENRLHTIKSLMIYSLIKETENNVKNKQQKINKITNIQKL